MNPRKSVESIKHRDKRANIPTEELRDFVARDEQSPATLLYPRDPSLDPQLVWKGKDEQDRQDLAIPTVPVYIQEKIHPQALINDLLRQHERTAGAGGAKRSGVAEDPARYAAAYEQPDLFGDFNGLPEEFDQRVDFYHHEQNWSNRMILGDSLLVMTSLAEKEGLRGKVQCIYFDPPYGIKFGSNWQVSTRKRDVKDGKAEDATRQPEQIRAFRDTWKLGIHSYLAYLRDRLTVARDLLTETGSVFVQIGDENVHLVRCVMDEIFGSENFCKLIIFKKTAGDTSTLMPAMCDYILWYAKAFEQVKYRPIFVSKTLGEASGTSYQFLLLSDDTTRRATDEEMTGSSPLPFFAEPFASADLKRDGFSATANFEYKYENYVYYCGSTKQWKTNREGLDRLAIAGWLFPVNGVLRYKRFLKDFPATLLGNIWTDTETGSFLESKLYVVQTSIKVIQRCLLMTTDPGDLVLDPTCGSGTTAYVAEQWGRRWITIDTSRVALALARTRLMAAKYPYYHLADNYPRITQINTEEEIKNYLRKSAASADSSSCDIRKGFVYKRVPHVTLKSIANNEEIDAIHAKWTARMEPIRREINKALGVEWEEWQVPREDDPQISRMTQMKKNSSADLKSVKSVASVDLKTAKPVKSASSVDKLLSEWWRLRRERQREIDASIARRAETETLYDQPYEDNKRVRVCGPFSVESLSPHRVLSTADENQDGTVSEQEARKQQDFAAMILENLRKAGVQNTKRNERLVFETLETYPGRWLHAAGTYVETVGSGQGMGGSGQGMGGSGRKTDLSPLATEHCRRVAVSIGPEHGTVGPQQVKEAAMEAVKGVGFDLLVVCGFAFDPHVSEEVKRYGKLTVLPAKMNPDLVMGDEFLKKTGAGNLFMVFGEPDVEVDSEEWIVDRNERRVTSYEQYKIVSRTDGLAEINGLGREGVSCDKRLSPGGSLRIGQPNAESSGFDSIEHRRRAIEELHGRIPAFSGNQQGKPGGIGNTGRTGRKAELPDASATRESRGGMRGDRENAERLDAIAALRNLTADHLPLTTARFIRVELRGVDVYDPTTGQIRSSSTDDIACWFIDTDYSGESFFVRQAYFTGAEEPYDKLKRALRSEIDEAAWSTLYSTVSLPFPRPESGKIAVKVINHYGDEVLRVFEV